MSKRIPFLILGLLAVAFAAGALARGRIGVVHSPESIRFWVQSLGWQAPLIFVALVVFRQFLLLPSAILLPVGGLCFGALAGTGLGAIGIVLSGLMKYLIARSIGRDSVESWLGERFRRFGGRLDRGGPVVVGLITAHPMGPMGPCHWGAGLSSIRLPAFAVAVAAGALLRSAAYALVGSTLLAPGSSQFYLASAVLLAAILLPLAHPALRRRLFGANATATSP
jgi:uncharacterized membrane protein YdjX (TVP38/TMEM64 family)